MQVRIRRRPWWAWLSWILWVLWLLFWAEAAVGSWKEMETRAYTISLVILVVSLLMGFHVWLVGYLGSRSG